MAFTKIPQGDTYQSKDIPFVYKWDSRALQHFDAPWTDRDGAGSMSKNVIPELVSSQSTQESFYHAYKRDGCSHLTWGVSAAPSVINDDFSNPIIGIHTNTATGYTIVLTAPGGISTGFFVLNPVQAQYDVENVFSGTFPTSMNGGLQLTFTDFVYDNGEKAVFVNAPGGSDLCKLKLSGGFASSVSGVLPANNNGDLVALDGYLFCSNANGDIFNSNLNDPLTWNASNFISAESYGDGLRKIARSGAYIVAFGSDSIEFFYDAANPTGSPLSVYQGATKRIGYLGGLAQIGDSLYFVGKTANGAPSLYKIEGLKITPVVDFSQARNWQSNQSDSFNVSTGNFLSLNGHTIYVWHSIANDGNPICFDIDTGLFVSISFKGGDFDSLQTASLRFAGLQGGVSSLLCRELDPRVYYYAPGFYQDDGVNYTVLLQTNNLDFGSRRNKFGGRFLLHADQTETASFANVSFSTDDYQTFSTPRAINLADQYPAIWGIGLFRKLATRLTYSDNFPMRFIMGELDYNIGGA